MDYFIPGFGRAKSGQGFVVAGIRYPADWLEKADPASVAAKPAPAHAPDTQVLECDPTAGWAVRDKTAAELAAALAAAKEAATAAVNASAEAERARFITSGDGQAMTYAAKEAEARALQAGGAGPFPFLEAEAAEVGLTVSALAADVVATADAWRAVAARVEATRKGAQHRLHQAGDVATVAALHTWALAALAAAATGQPVPAPPDTP